MAEKKWIPLPPPGRMSLRKSDPESVKRFQAACMEWLPRRDPTEEEVWEIRIAHATFLDHCHAEQAKEFARGRKKECKALSWLNEIIGSGHPCLNRMWEEQYHREQDRFASESPFKTFRGAGGKWFALRCEADESYLEAAEQEADEPVIVDAVKGAR